MAFNTGNPIGSTDARDLSDNAQNFDEAINDRAATTWTDRLGVARKTVWGAFSEITYKAPVSYVIGLSFLTTDANKTVEEAGVVYAPLNSALPFTTSGTFSGDDDGRFYPVQDKNNVIRVTTIADIEAYSAPDGYVFSLNAGGRSGTFDVVAGDFSSELAADTENGVYVGLSDNPTASSKVAKRRYQGAVSPKWFGAVGDGIFDDTLSIQECENNRGSSFICFPSGTYISSGIIIKSNGGWFSESGAEIKAIKTESSNCEITISDANGITDFCFYGLNFDGNKEEILPYRYSLITAGAGCYLSVYKCNFRNTITESIVANGSGSILECKFLEGAPHGGTLGEATKYILLQGEDTLFKILQCSFTAPSGMDIGKFPGGIFVAGTSPRVIVSDCYFENIGQFAEGNFIGCVDLYTAGNGSQIYGNHIKKSKYQALKLQNSSQVYCGHNLIEDSEGSVADINFQSGARSSGITCGNSIIESNIILNGNGIVVQGTTSERAFNVKVINNIIDSLNLGVETCIFVIRASDSITVSGNVARSEQDCQIKIEDFTGDIFIKDNNISSSSNEVLLFARTSLSQANFTITGNTFLSSASPCLTVRDVKSLVLDGNYLVGNIDVLGVSDYLRTINNSAGAITVLNANSGARVQEIANSWNPAVLYGTTQPSTTGHLPGTILHKTNVVSGGIMGWVNVGTFEAPVWSTWGTIS